MNATACNAPDEFLCQNTHCIWAGVQCDGINNCGDGSDENSLEHPHCSMYKQLKQIFFSRIGNKCIGSIHICNSMQGKPISMFRKNLFM